VRNDCNGHGSAPRRRVGLIAVLGCLAFVLCLPLDPMLSGLLTGIQVKNDLRRELEFLQQFGAITSVILILLSAVLLDPGARPLLPRFILALAAPAAAAWVLKCLIGRGRPKLENPYLFVPPWRAHPVPLRDGSVAPLHSWEFWNSSAALLNSLPSSHTSAAFAFAALLSWRYRPLRHLVVAIAFAVGVCRLLFGSHYLSDVVAGGVLGWTVASLVLQQSRAKTRV